MRKILTLTLLALLPLAAAAQDNTRNYVLSTTYKIPYNPPPNTTIPVSDNDKTVNITYYDGLGRPIQQIAHKQSISGFDIITHMDYDTLSGRKTKDYLPYIRTNSSLGFDSSAASSQASFYASPDPTATGTNYFEATTNPYSETFFEKSPLGAVLKKAAPGNDWLGSATSDNDRSVKFVQQTNGPGEVLKFTVTTSWIASDGLYLPALVASGTYDHEQLFKTITRDENWQPSDGHNHTTEEFTNKKAQVVLKRSYCDNIPLDTYYVYDDYGKLTYMLPPLLDATGTIDATKLNGICYQYRYDQRNRMVERKLPGKQWEYMVYDKLDRLVATGPAYDPFGGGSEGWIITRYDVFGRVAYTGWVPETMAFSTATRKLFAAPYADPKVRMNETKTGTATMLDGIEVFYTNAVYTYTGLKLLTVNYYDNYIFPNPPQSFPIMIFGAAALENPKGLKTGAFIRTLDSPSQQHGESSYILYDSEEREISSYVANYLGGYHRTETKYTFNGLPVKTITTHTPNATDDAITITEDFEYAPNQQLIKTVHKVDGGDEELLSLNHYSELGQLVSKKCGGPDTSGDAFLQKVDYSYNVRGWLKGINDISDLGGPDGPADLFAFAINYNTINVATPGATPLFNGNISETQWRTANDNVHRGYSYAYDPLNRLRKAEYFLSTGPDLYEIRNSYDESMEYDANGNILSMNRTGDVDDATEQIEIDDLAYGYDPDIPNRLLSVTDDTLKTSGFKDGNTSGNDFSYDDYGNLIEDRNKEIERITYNHMNLPVHITVAHNNSIDYLYDATGQKLNKRVTDSSGVALTRYINGFQYHNGVLQFFPTSEGYVKNTVVDDVNVYSYAYNYTDHLGNVRLTYGFDPLDEQVKIMEENNYYPFGLRHRNYNMDYKTYYYQYQRFGISPVEQMIAGRYNRKYQGQERQDELGLNWDSFKWRNYDYAIGRFMSIDPLAEKYGYNSPYAFAENKIGLGRELEGLELFSNLRNKMIIERAKHQEKTPTRWEQAYNPVTGNTDGLKYLASFFTPSAPQKVEKTSDRDIESTATSKNAGGENPKTTGEKTGDNIETDGMVAAAPTATSGNSYSSFTNVLEYGSSLFGAFEKGGDAVEQAKGAIEDVKGKKDKTAKKDQDSTTVQTYEKTILVKTERKATKDVEQ